jgi:PAS domain S-box-containing protein
MSPDELEKTKAESLDRSLIAFDIVSADGKFIYANEAYLKLWGYDSLVEIKGTSPASHCADPLTPATIIGQLKAEGSCNIEFKGKRKDGSTFDVHMWATLSHDQEGNEIYPTTSIDISEQKKAIKSRDEFLSVASHELKTPITSLQLQTQLQMRRLSKLDPIDPTLQNFFRTQLKQIHRIDQLINDMLDLSRINTGRFTIRPSNFDLISLVQEVLENFTDQYKQFEVKFHTTLSSLEVCWDESRIQQVLENIFSNAGRYGGSPVEIKVETQKEDVIIKVSDHGPGIKEEDLSRVFLRFERAQAPEGVNGLGLGLNISQEIIHDHGGEISVQSSPEKTEFKLRIPRTPTLA